LSLKLCSGLAFVLLAACASLGPSGETDELRDLVAYGAGIEAASEDERRNIYVLALNSHRTEPSAISAIRLAIASLGVEDFNPSAELLTLLAYAERSTTSEDLIEFAGLLRPMVERLVEQQAAITNESEARQSLAAQLEALRALEEQLDTPGVRP
jgi:hypothetical protein